MGDVERVLFIILLLLMRGVGGRARGLNIMWNSPMCLHYGSKHVVTESPFSSSFSYPCYNCCKKRVGYDIIMIYMNWMLIRGRLSTCSCGR